MSTLCVFDLGCVWTCFGVDIEKPPVTKNQLLYERHHLLPRVCFPIFTTNSSRLQPKNVGSPPRNANPSVHIGITRSCSSFRTGKPITLPLALCLPVKSVVREVGESFNQKNGSLILTLPCDKVSLSTTLNPHPLHPLMTTIAIGLTPNTRLKVKQY